MRMLRIEIGCMNVCVYMAYNSNEDVVALPANDLALKLYLMRESRTIGLSLCAFITCTRIRFRM